MRTSTDVATLLGSLRIGDPEERRQGLARKSARISQRKIAKTHVALGDTPSYLLSNASELIVDPPRLDAELRKDVMINGTPLEVWEGVVKEVDRANGTMTVNLDAKMGQMPRHTADIELEWVTDQDRDLVVPGAVFYLTLFKRTKPSVENAQELRFRRRPSWTSAQIRQVANDAAMIATKLRPLPIAE